MPIHRSLGGFGGLLLALLTSACTAPVMGPITPTDQPSGGLVDTPPPTPQSVRPTLKPGDGGALLGIVIRPDAARAIPVPGASSGVLGAARFAARTLVDLPVGRTDLDNFHFLVAAEKDWRLPDGSEVDIQVLEFGAEGATAFLESADIGLHRDPTLVSTTDITGIDPHTNAEVDGTRYEWNPDEHGVRTALITGGAGNIDILMYVHASSGFDRATEQGIYAAQLVAVERVG